MSQQSPSLRTMQHFAEELKSLDEKTLTTPLAPGKWSIREIIGHLYYWDLFLIEEMIPAFQRGKYLPSFPNHDVYNHAAIASLEGRKAERIIDSFLKIRSSLIGQLETIDQSIRLPEKNTGTFYSSQQLDPIFTKHDQHHQKQIEIYLSNRTGD